MDENSHKGHRENVRRRFLTGGLEVFAPHEVLELLLFYAIPQKDTNPLAHKLMEKFGTLSRVSAASVEELREVEGIGEQTAVLLSLVFQIGRWLRLENCHGRRLDLSSPNALRDYFTEMFSGETKAAVYQLCLNQRGNVLIRCRMTNGSIVSVSQDVRTLVQNAVLSRCAYVVLAHNHTGGGAEPEPDDIDASRRIETALSAMNIKLQDHIIVSGKECVSMRERGFLNYP